ncbi:hypothetical protein [Candidatus Amarolinea dominans]|uniref:hypothetical protein n=1 Tax=Candidatus Amarolinea dominans TaxID=3140696 RepID=UPI001DB70760|nr:hypothetical protein [Anaerolineae bacterium]
MSGSKRLPIPESVREQVARIVTDFNREVIKNPECFYVPRYRGSFLYFDRRNYGAVGPIARLTYQGGMNDWTFAIYKYSNEQYDSRDWFFPGSEHADGTVVGAMKAGLEAYPLGNDRRMGAIRRLFVRLFGHQR